MARPKYLVNVKTRKVHNGQRNNDRCRAQMIAREHRKNFPTKAALLDAGYTNEDACGHCWGKAGFAHEAE